MNKKFTLALIAVAILGFSAFKATTAGEKDADVKSVAWYVANIPAAKKQNQECYNKPEIQSSPNCLNSLHALQISFNGGN